MKDNVFKFLPTCNRAQDGILKYLFFSKSSRDTLDVGWISKRTTRSLRLSHGASAQEETSGRNELSASRQQTFGGCSERLLNPGASQRPTEVPEEPPADIRTS